MSTLGRMQHAMRELFDDDDLEVTDATVAADVSDWDSLNHVRLIVALERDFGVRFDAGELEGLQSVGDLRRAIERKLV